MVEALGQRLLVFLRQIGRSRTWTVIENAMDSGSVWRLSGATWKARIIVDPQRWIGLAFEARDPMTGRTVNYDIDTDLYDIETAHRDFACEIEAEIVGFLESLRGGRVLRMIGGRSFVLLVPDDEAFIRIAKGRFLTTRQHGFRPDADDEYVPVD